MQLQHDEPSGLVIPAELGAGIAFGVDFVEPDVVFELGVETVEPASVLELDAGEHCSTSTLERLCFGRFTWFASVHTL